MSIRRCKPPRTFPIRSKESDLWQFPFRAPSSSRSCSVNTTTGASCRTSPILTDVWIAFAKDPDKPQELLITPAKRESAGKVAHLIDARVNRTGAEIAPLQGVIAAKLYFDEVLRVIVPMTEWWKMDRVRKQIGVYDNEQAGAERLNEAINRIIAVGEWMKSDFQDCPSVDMLPAIDRLIALAGLILWARQQSSRNEAENTLAEALDLGSQEKIFLTLSGLLEEIKAAEKKNETLVRLISLNRTATAAVARSVPAVKADAARALFHVDCSTITWAVVDSGIKGDHPPFATGNQKTPASMQVSTSATSARS